MYASFSPGKIWRGADVGKKYVGGRRGEGVLLKERMETLLYEGGVAAPRILELLLGFWSKMWKFIRPFMKKGTLKPKIEKRALLPLFYCLCADIYRKKSQISVQVACGDHIVLISQTDNICFSLYIKDYW